MNIIFEAFHDCSSFLVVLVLDHFSTDAAVTPNIATGHQIVTLFRSICTEEKAQNLEPLMSKKFCLRVIHVCSLACFHLLQDWLTFWALLNA